MTTRTKRKGFSLAEILVSVAIVAVIAAVVIPSIGSQVNKGETGRVSGDLVNVRGAVEQFLADVRRYPSSMAQLQKVPVASTATDTGINFSGQFTAAQVARWKGPYMTKDFTTTATTGYGSQMVTLFRVCDNVTLTLTSCTAPVGAVGRYLTVTIPGISQAEAQEIDNAMDDGVLTTGQIRWITCGVAPCAGGAKDSLRYLALPIQ